MWALQGFVRRVRTLPLRPPSFTHGAAKVVQSAPRNGCLVSPPQIAPQFARALQTEIDEPWCDEPDLPSQPVAKRRVKPLVLDSHRSGIEIMQDPLFNKGTAFNQRERDRFGLRGLLPPVTFDIQDQLERTYEAYHRAGGTAQRDRELYKRQENVVAKHLFLVNLQDRNETLFYRLLCDHIAEMAPIIYTPVVGYACKNAGALFRRSRGMFIDGFRDRGDMHSILGNWPGRDVEVIVVTDGSRILGLGDLGVHGYGIPIGKLSLYVAAGGLDPTKVLPVTIDMGTNNEQLRKDRLYLGQRQERMNQEDMLAVMDEFMFAVGRRWPNCLVQFEDFKTPNAELLLNRYRKHFVAFNDDIQGTGAMTLAGLLSALRCQGKGRDDLVNQRIVCVGAGSAGIGVCQSIIMGMQQVQPGLSQREAAQHFWLFDNRGTITRTRKDLQLGQHRFARKERLEDLSLTELVRAVKPTILLGVSGVGGLFTESVVRAMADVNEQPIIFPMSNPTDRAECTAEQAYDWSDGRVLFASGSPFKPVERNGQVVMSPSQANNMFIFPGVGLGVVAARAKHVSDAMLYAAATQLSECVTDAELENFVVFPDINNIRQVSLKIAVAVAQVAEKEGLARRTPPSHEDLPGHFPGPALCSTRTAAWEAFIADMVWTPEYHPLVMDSRDK